MFAPMVVWFSIDKYGDYPQMTVTSREVEGFFFLLLYQCLAKTATVPKHIVF